MGLFRRSLSMLHCVMIVVVSLLLSPSQFNEAQTVTNDARELDDVLQDYAYRAFVRPRLRTGVVYDAVVPSNLSAVQIAALRLRSGSLRRRGNVTYKEFDIPKGVIVRPYVTRLVLVYQNLGNLSVKYYPLPGYSYLTPVLGLLAYNATNLSATDLPELNIRASGKPITITFPDVKPAPDGSVAQCVWFDLNGSASFSNVVSGNNCSTIQQGHFSIVVASVAPPPPTPSEVPPPPRREGKESSSKTGVIVGSVLGGLGLLAILAVLVLWVQKLKKRKGIQLMEREAEVGESLRMTTIGETKAPAATVTRTQPTLETEYAP